MKQYKELQLEITDPAVRLDKILAASHPEYSRSQVGKWFQEQQVSLRGRVLKASDKLPAGTMVTVRLEEVSVGEAEAEDIPLDIRYEDEYLLVVNKPRGMVVHPGAGNREGTLVSALLHRYGSKLSDEGGMERPGIVHRIDKDTSGLLMVVKNNQVHRIVSEQLRAHEIERVYQAVVHGHVRDQSGMIIAPIGRDQRHRQRQAIRADGREAITHFELVEQLRGTTWVELRLETGRTHQIRVHMNYIGHPLVGDTVYAGKRERYGMDGQALHASDLIFSHPITGEKIHVHAELPPVMEDLIGRLRR